MGGWLLLKVYALNKQDKRFLFDAVKADTIEKKIEGIMFSSPQFTPLLFEFYKQARKQNSVHSLFCPKFDAVFLDSSKRVVDVRRDIHGIHFFITPQAPSKYLLEVPAGTAVDKEIVVGTQLFW